MIPQNSSSSEGRPESLALLYQGVLTAIVRVQSGRQPMVDAAGFRKRIRDVLVEIEREAVRLGYSAQDISDTTYAVVAFLDEAIMSSTDPNRGSWVSLQAEMYEKADAGEVFFDQLKRLSHRRDSAELADILEVYYLCLLLGYRGRYALGHQSELRQTMQDLRERFETIRGVNPPLSPAGLPPAVQAAPVKPVPRAPSPPMAMRAPLFALALAIGSWVVYRVLLGSQADDVRRAVLSMLVP